MLIPHNFPTIGKEEERAAQKVLLSKWLAQGAEVAGFESEFCKFLGLPDGHAVAVSSGTAALFLALWAVGAKNKKVAFPSYVCSSLRHAVHLVGAKEVLLDSSLNVPNIDLNLVPQNDGSIVIAPHLFGIPIEIKGKNKRIIIEDCCQSLGAKLRGKSVGLFGTLSIFSFYATKLITTGGQGGMVVSTKKNLIDAIKDYRDFDCRRDWKKRFNFQMTDLQAAIGRVQLRKLPNFISRREEIFLAYVAAGLNMLGETILPNKDIFPVRYRAILKTDGPRATIKRLNKNGIKAIVPIEDWELLGSINLYPNAKMWSRCTVSLPIYPSLKDSEIKLIIKSLKS